MARLDLARLKGDVVGGITSALLTVPMSMGYGVLALLPLGVRYLSVASLATVLLATVVGGSLAHEHGDQALALTFLIIFVAGIAQTLFGLLRLGTLIRYIPSPVMAGFQNAVAVLILVSQLPAMLGIPRE